MNTLEFPDQVGQEIEAHGALGEGIVQLEKLQEVLENRRSIVLKYRELLEMMRGVSIPSFLNHDTSACHILPVLLHSAINRHEFMGMMKKATCICKYQN